MTLATEDFIDLDEDKVLALSGPAQRYLALIEGAYHVLIETPGGGFQVTGKVRDRQRAGVIINALSELYDEGVEISEVDVRTLIQNPTGKSPVWADHHGQSHVIVMGRKGAIAPKTEGQAAYYKELLRNDLTFGLGPAGSGKTFMAVAHGTSLLLKGAVDRLVITRPAVEAGEKLGFLPGDLNEKVDPYLMPIWQALDDILGAESLRRRRERNEIEVAPLAYMRGRTLSNAYVIVDEAQNTTKQQMKMVLTRLGEGSKMVVTGDPSQVDLPRASDSGLVHAVGLLNGVKGVGVSRLTADDVVRHELVARIVRAYDSENMTEFAPLIDIEVEHDDWTDALPDVSAVVTSAIEATFAHLGAKEQLDLVVLLADDAEMKALNKEFRQKNAPTNVLSFPAPDMMHPHLGDIAFGYETCVREAKEQNKTLKDHVAHLSVHGALHLLGYDHINDPEAEEMEDLERKILQGLGIADPYLTNG